MERLIQTASDRRRLFRTGDQNPGHINAIVYAYGRPRQRRLHWVIAGVFLFSMGALSLAAHHAEPESDMPRMEAVSHGPPPLLGGP